MLRKPTTCNGCPLYHLPFGKVDGFVPADGSGDNGVLVVLEAAGEDEENAGKPTVGRAGQYLWGQLKRVGLERGDFRIHNVLSCRPPGNQLLKMPYTEAAISHCAPNLDGTIAEMKDKCTSTGKTFTILALGRFAFKRIMGYDDKHPILRYDYQCYPHWSVKYNCWVIATDHPSHIMQGSHHKAPVMQFAAQRAVEIADKGLQRDAPVYSCDPDPSTFDGWVRDYLAAVERNPVETYLSYDIETPYKQGKDESEVAREDEDDYTILRASFAYRPGDAVSIPWEAKYRPYIEQLFASRGPKVGWNSSVYDDPRILADKIVINGSLLDAMLAWHVLNSSLPKGLGYVTPFYNHTSEMWKHLSDSKPAFYSAKDAAMTLTNWLGIHNDLKNNALGPVFDRHVIRLNEVLTYMSRQGVLRDEAGRKAAEERLQGILDGLDEEMKGAVPDAARKYKIYKKSPKSTDGMVQVSTMGMVTRCNVCACTNPTKSHFKSKIYKQCDFCGVAWKRGHKCDKPTLREMESNLCANANVVSTEESIQRWAKPLEWKISNVGLQAYQGVVKHQAIFSRKNKRIVFDEKALKTLRKRYPNDKLYPLIGSYREAQKLLSTYVGVTQEDGRIRGGMPVGRDGKIHCLYTHNPSTLRLASQQPNMQNLPRPGKKDDLQTIIRNLIVAEPGTTFLARDFSGIEAVLVGYEAKDPGYIRLARRDVHSFYTAYALYHIDKRISANDLPMLSWDDEKLFTRLGEIKAEFKTDRNNLYKHLVHAINFGQGAPGAQEKIYLETGIVFDVKLIQTLMDLYNIDLFPTIPKWHKQVRMQADLDGYLRNAFGYVHRFSHVFKWTKIGGRWEQKPGDDAEAVLAFKPQSNAAGIMKEALLRLFFERYEEAGQYLRLTVHDEVFCQVPIGLEEKVDAVLTEEMERTVPELALPEVYNMGKALSILTESKVGTSWGTMS